MYNSAILVLAITADAGSKRGQQNENVLSVRCYCDGSIAQKPAPRRSRGVFGFLLWAETRRRSRLQNRRACLTPPIQIAPSAPPPPSRSTCSIEQSVHDEVCGQGSLLPVHHHLGVVQRGTRLYGAVRCGRRVHVGRDQIHM